MAIDITNQAELRKLTLRDLVKDAVERKDKEALRFLEDSSNATIIKTTDEGEEYEIPKPLMTIRKEYLEKYLGYIPPHKKTAEELRAANKAKRAKERQDMFAEAFRQIQED